MRYVNGNIWYVFGDAIVIPTNGFVKKDGRAVMGRGLAKQAVDRWPHLARLLGEAITDSGNHVKDLWKPTYGPTIITFPVKEHWGEKADPELIKRSVGELVALVDRIGVDDRSPYTAHRWNVTLPRVGCGNGGLDWANEVEPLLAPLDDRFMLMSLYEGSHSWGCENCRDGYLGIEGIGGTICSCECHVDVPHKKP